MARAPDREIQTQAARRENIPLIRSTQPMRDLAGRAGRSLDGVAPHTRLLALLERNEGASVAELAEVTGW